MKQTQSPLLLVALVLGVLLASGSARAAGSAWSSWDNGPSTDDGYFPIGVWLQDPNQVTQWQAVGINLYMGLWGGPTEAQLDKLRLADMQVLADQNAVGLNYKKTLADGRPVIVGWLLPDEPDNAQPKAGGGYGPPIPTADIQSAASTIRANDPTRPIFLNLSQGIAWDNQTWIGQGGKIVPSRDYPAYLAAADIVSFDIYPMAESRAEIRGDLWRVGLGMDRLQQYAPPGAVKWTFIETGDIHANGNSPTPQQINAEVWLSIIHGATGIGYFIHGKSTAGNFDSIALLRPEHEAQLQAVKQTNQQIRNLAAVLNSPTWKDSVKATGAEGELPVDLLVKRHDGAIYIFSEMARDQSGLAHFDMSAIFDKDATVEVLGENRTVQAVNGRFSDDFTGYQVHLYKITGDSIPEPAGGILGLFGGWLAMSQRAPRAHPGRS